MITKEEILAIYKRNGRPTVNENIAQALADAMSLVGERVLASLAKLAEKQGLDHQTVSAAIVELAQVVSTTQQRPATRQQARGVCYCGTAIGGPKCEVCGRVH